MENILMSHRAMIAMENMGFHLIHHGVAHHSATCAALYNPAFADQPTILTSTPAAWNPSEYCQCSEQMRYVYDELEDYEDASENDGLRELEVRVSQEDKAAWVLVDYNEEAGDLCLRRHASVHCASVLEGFLMPHDMEELLPMTCPFCS